LLVVELAGRYSQRQPEAEYLALADAVFVGDGGSRASEAAAEVDDILGDHPGAPAAISVKLGEESARAVCGCAPLDSESRKMTRTSLRLTKSLKESELGVPGWGRHLRRHGGSQRKTMGGTSAGCGPCEQKSFNWPERK
jgi:hypothetical protein